MRINGEKAIEMNRRDTLVQNILERLEDESEAIRKSFADGHRGTPTRFCAIDDLLPQAVAEEIYEAFPRDGEGFLTRKSFREHKRTSFDFDALPDILADITFALQSQAVVDKVGDLIGMEALEPDPHLYAGGLSMMFEGDFLNPHIDNSHEKTKTKYRRLNLLYYVSPGWKEEFGANLELWDPDVTTPVTIESRFNRLVLMETNKVSWHSVSPGKVDRPRCCVSNYYFSEKSPDGDDYYHVTSFTGRPDQPIRRMVGRVDNVARTVVRKAGVGRKTDAGYEGDKAGM